MCLSVGGFMMLLLGGWRGLFEMEYLELRDGSAMVVQQEAGKSIWLLSHGAIGDLGVEEM
jgi:hypothetical protein